MCFQYDIPGQKKQTSQEESFRFQKTDLCIDSLRLRDWEPRRKLLWLVTVASGFRLWILAPALSRARTRLLRRWQPRADWRQWQAKLPLYRHSFALSRLWGCHSPCWAHCQPYRRHAHITWPACSLRWWMTLWHQTGYVF